jgi:hypothetical protein
MADNSLVQGNDFAETTITASAIGGDSSFVQRRLQAQFTLPGNLLFPGTSSDTLTVSNLRISARINKAQNVAGCTMYLRIYGMTLGQMNALNTLGLQYNLLNRSILVLSAGDLENGYAVVYQGQPLEAYPRFESMPDVEFYVTANSTADISVLAMGSPTYASPSISVSSEMKRIATAAGLGFENSSGFDVQMHPPYLWGSPKHQLNELAEAADINWMVDDGIVAIWPKLGGTRTPPGGVVPLVTPTTGLIGFPYYWPSGVIFKTVFNPTIKTGGLVKLQSAQFQRVSPSGLGGQPNLAYQQAIDSGRFPSDGIWAVAQIDHYLDAWIPHGQWYSLVLCYNPKLGVQSLPPSVIPPA